MPPIPNLPPGAPAWLLFSQNTANEFAAGHYASATRKAVIETAAKLGRQGPRIVEEVAKVTGNVLRGAGLGAEAEGVIIAGEAIAVAPEIATLSVAARLALGWEGVLTIGAAAVSSPLVICLVVVSAGFVLACATARPASAESVGKELRSKEFIDSILKDIRKHHITEKRA